jgi:hypothetical protein
MIIIDRPGMQRSFKLIDIAGRHVSRLAVIGEKPVVTDGKIYLMGYTLPIHNGDPRIISPALRPGPYEIDSIGAESNETWLSLSINVNHQNR